MPKKPIVRSKTKPSTVSSDKVLQIAFFVVVIVAASVVHQYYSNISNFIRSKLKEHPVWKKDSDFRSIIGSAEIATCDFQQLNVSDLSNSASLFEDNGLPIIVRGAAANWKAIKKWEKDNLLLLYGNRSIQMGSESSIVYSGGTAASPAHLKSIIDRLENNTDVTDNDSFVFDASILQSTPELMEDIEIFKVFQHWDTPANEKKKTMWHMLSLGPSRSGLPFHSHGRTWLAVIHGAKQWYVYPPGYSPPAAVERTQNPLLPVIDWFQKVLPLLKPLPKPPLQGANHNTHRMTTEDRERGFQPLSCVQESGDLVFLPARWSHLTLNIGETIAIGGQAGLGAAKRHASALETLKKNPLHFESLKDVGLGQAHMAMERTKHIQQSIEQLLQYNNAQQKNKNKKQQQPEEGDVDQALILQLRSQSQLSAMLTATHDSWLVLHVESAAKKESATSDETAPSEVVDGLTYDEILAAATELTEKLEDRVDVAIFDVSNAPGTVNKKDEVAEGGDRKTFTLRLHGGDVLHTDSATEAALSVAQASKNYQPDEMGVLYTGDVKKVEDVVKFVDETMNSHQWQRGSVNGVTVLVQNMFLDAIQHVKKAVELKPLHPETRGMLGELSGLSGSVETMKKSIAESVAVFDAVDRGGISPQSIASVYHKLGTSYLSKDLADEAIPLLRRSLEILPSYVPALADLTICHLINHDRPQALSALKQLILTAPDHPGIPRFKQAVMGMSS